MADQGQDRELKNALAQIEKQFGKGAIMQLGERTAADLQPGARIAAFETPSNWRHTLDCGQPDWPVRTALPH